MITINKYRLYCNTEDEFRYVWNDVTPTTCPSGVGHTIDSDSITIIESHSDQDVQAHIVEENVQTGGHYQARFVVMPISGSGWTELDISWPIPVSLLSGEYTTCSGAEKGDEVEAAVAPDTITGVVTSGVSVSGIVIGVSQTVIDNTSVGFYLKLDDGTNVNDLGRVLSIDSTNLTVTVETGATNSFSPATPTYVKQTVKFISTSVLVGPGSYSLGRTKIGASYIPVNTVLRLRYKNNGVNDEKCLSITLEYLY